MSPGSARPHLALPLLTCLIASSISGWARPSSLREVRTVAASAASLKADVPPLAREKCAGAPLPAGPKPTETDYQVFGVRQTAKLEACEGKRALAVAAADMHNAYVDRLVEDLRPPTFWERLFGKRRAATPKPDPAP
jgi:hypothetical protein